MLSNKDLSGDQKTAARLVQAAHGFQQERDAGFTMLIGIGACRLLLKVENGAVTGAIPLSSLKPLTPWDFSISADAESWQRFWESMPAAGWHDLFALTRNGRMQIEGNLHPFMAHLQFIKDLLASPRTEGGK